MTKILYAIENSFEAEPNGIYSDLAAGIAFLAMIIAGMSWLIV